MLDRDALPPAIAVLNLEDVLVVFGFPQVSMILNSREGDVESCASEDMYGIRPISFAVWPLQPPF